MGDCGDFGNCDCGNCGDCGNCDCDCGDCNCGDWDCSGCDCCGCCSCFDCSEGGENCCEGCGYKPEDHKCCACRCGDDYVACPSWCCPCCQSSDGLTTYCCFTCSFVASDVTDFNTVGNHNLYSNNHARRKQNDEKRPNDLENGDVPAGPVTDQPVAEAQKEVMVAVTTQPMSNPDQPAV